MPLPWAQANSVPERFTPCGTTCLPVESTSLFPATCSLGGAVSPPGGVVESAAVRVGRRMCDSS
jgi:hypothetical protein